MQCHVVVLRRESSCQGGKKENQTASGGQSDKQQPVPVQSVKSLSHLERDSNTFSL